MTAYHPFPKPDDNDTTLVETLLDFHTKLWEVDISVANQFAIAVRLNDKEATVPEIAKEYRKWYAEAELTAELR